MYYSVPVHAVGDVLGERPSDTETKPFTLHESLNSTATETTAERTESFNTVYKTGAWGKGWDPQYKDLNGSGRGRSTFYIDFPYIYHVWSLKHFKWQTFSRQCLPEPSVCFTFIVLYTSRQNQTPVIMFTKYYNRPGCLWDIRFVQRNSQNRRLYASLPSAFLSCRWHHHALFRFDVSTVPVQPSLSITVNGTNFGRPLKPWRGRPIFSVFRESRAALVPSLGDWRRVQPLTRLLLFKRAQLRNIPYIKWA